MNRTPFSISLAALLMALSTGAVATMPGAAAAQNAADGPALAPTESPDDTSTPVSDGTSTISVPSITRSAPPVRRAPQPPVDTTQAATLLADNVEVYGDNQLRASGGVVVWHQGVRLVASAITYDGTTDRLTIEGPIHLTQPARAGTPEETILIADSAQLESELTDGILKGARLVLGREMQVAAEQATRSEGGRITTLRRVVASSCQVCASNPVPLWEIRARQITHDADTDRLMFDQPQFRVMGQTVFALPYLSAPGPSVDRATGFLRPQFRTTSGLGAGVKLPYFITLGDHADLTLTPYLAFNRTATLAARYRQAFWNGAMEWQGAVSRDDIRPDATRGYLFGAGKFLLPGDFNFGFQVQTTSDRGYLLDYDVTDADRLWSGVTIERVRRDEWIVGRAGIYRTLREDETDSTQPGQVAEAMWQRRFRPAWIGGEGGVTFETHGHRRPSGQNEIGRDVFRNSVTLDWRRSEILPGGLVGAVQTELGADLYSIGQDDAYDPWVSRLDPVVAAELRWPLVKSAGSATHVIEPVMQVVWSPEHNSSKLPNEDSTLLEFDEGNLFSLSRFPGRDRREGGLRANVGVTWTRLDPTGWSLGVTAGRVFREEVADGFAPGTPLGGRRSDWLLATHFQNNDGLSISNRALLDDALNLRRNELRLGWLKPGLQVSAGYLWIDSSSDISRQVDVSELTIDSGWQVKDGWWATASTRYDFTADRAQRAALGVQYSNECVTMDMAVSRRFTSSDSVRPETNFGLSVQLNGFGRQPSRSGKVARRTCVR
ncbi:LPS-assembly protein LptD [Paracoccus pacificus]|uniref:LPS-assembly protein LptD n=1 Tax=Paracoccus pacificus TaxID=1463598 RepID=A0ABW4R826_9RHOB